MENIGAMKPLAKNPSTMQPSGIRVIMDLASNIPDVIHLEVGEPDFPTPRHIVEGVVKAAREGYTKYTPSAGFASLRELVAKKLYESNGIRATLENVTVTAGAVCGVATSIFALVDPGEEVLIPDPAWPNYRMIVHTAGAIPRGYPLHEQRGFLPDLYELERMITDRTKAIIVNTPSNPTGAVFPRELADDLVKFASKHDLYILSDEVYEKFIFEGEHVSPAIFDVDGRVISVFGFSKTYAMTGWRIGYVVAPTEISSVITKLQQPFVSCACSVSQKAAEVALSGPQGCVEAMREAYRKRRDMAVEIMEAYGLPCYIPQGAFYLWVNISGIGMDSYAFAKALLRDQKVAVAPGGAFGKTGDRYVRVSLAADKASIAQGLEKLCGYIEEAKK
jgi:aspartate/methionine/tyrosine aminotransferase